MREYPFLFPHIECLKVEEIGEREEGGREGKEGKGSGMKGERGRESELGECYTLPLTTAAESLQAVNQVFSNGANDSVPECDGHEARLSDCHTHRLDSPNCPTLCARVNCLGELPTTSTVASGNETPPQSSGTETYLSNKDILETESTFPFTGMT